MENIEEAVSEVEQWLRDHCDDLDLTTANDEQITLTIAELARTLWLLDRKGDDAEKAHANARHVAALAIFYLARGLS